jgi:predicted ATP-grasp superfamily ATP-dependent carboligase
MLRNVDGFEHLSTSYVHTFIHNGSSDVVACMPMKGSNIPAIVLGDGLNALSVARCLGRNAIPVHVIGKNKHCISSKSKYVFRRTQCEAFDKDLFIEAVGATAKEFNCEPAVMCSSDYFLQFSSIHRTELAMISRPVLPSSDSVNTVIDKGLFGDFCSRHSLPAPRSWFPENERECAAIADMAIYPLAVKPRIAHNAGSESFQKDGQFAKMMLAHDKPQILTMFSNLRNAGADLLLQEYIPGSDDEHYSYISYRDSQSQETAGVGIRKIRITPIHAGVATFAEISDDNELRRISHELLNILGYCGISSVCFKRHSGTGDLMLHEVNGRFPMVHSASLLNGINFPMEVYQDALGMQSCSDTRVLRGRRWVMLDGDIFAFRDYRQSGEIGLLDWLRSLLSVRVCVEFASDDWRPFLSWMKVIFNRVFRRFTPRTV